MAIQTITGKSFEYALLQSFYERLHSKLNNVVILKNEYYLTALAVNAIFAVPSGTPVNGNSLITRIKGDGTARTLDWNPIYRSTAVIMPITTVINETLYVKFIYNSTDSKWDCVLATIDSVIGHVIEDADGNDLEQRVNLQFEGLTTTDEGETPDRTKVSASYSGLLGVDDSNKVNASVTVYDILTGNRIDQEQEAFDKLLDIGNANNIADLQLPFYVPAGYKIVEIFAFESSSNAAGNISIGTAASGTQIVNAFTVGADFDNELTLVSTGRYFGKTTDQDCYISSSAWGSGVVDIQVNIRKIW